MAESTEARFTCPSCGSAYRWTDGVAGRRVSCKGCGIRMQAPLQAGVAADPVDPIPPREEAIYELAEPEDELVPGNATVRAAAGQKCPACNVAMKEGAVLCLNCGFNLTEGRRIRTVVKAGSPGESPPGTQASAPPAASTSFAAAVTRKGVDAEALAEDIAREHRINDLYWPAGLAGVALALILLNSLVLAPVVGMVVGFGSTSGTWLGIAAGLLVYAAIRFAVQLPMLFVGVLVVARVMGASFGPLGIALLKMAAIVLFVAATLDSVDIFFLWLTDGLSMCFSGILRLGLSMILFCGLAMKLFDLEYGESAFLWLFVLLVPAAVIMVVATLF